MANIPCPRRINCPGSDFPVENYSSEDPDIPQFCAMAFASLAPPLGYNPVCASRDDSITYTTGFACSPISYAAALLAAQNAANVAVFSTWNTPDCIPVEPVCNEEQCCEAVCPTGCVTTVCVDAGAICMLTLAEANAAALGLACQEAQQAAALINHDVGGNVALLPSVLPAATAGTAYVSQLAWNLAAPAASVTLVGGALPPGLALGANGLISGIPTSPGTYTFTVHMTAA